MDTVASGFGADVDYRIALAGSARVEDLVFAHQAHGECIYQRIAGVARLELRFATQVGYAETVAVRSNAADYAFEDGVVAVDFSLCRHCCISCRHGSLLPNALA